MGNIHYQHRFSEKYPQAVYNREARQKKAKTIISILEDYLEYVSDNEIPFLVN